MECFWAMPVCEGHRDIAREDRGDRRAERVGEGRALLTHSLGRHPPSLSPNPRCVHSLCSIRAHASLPQPYYGTHAYALVVCVHAHLNTYATDARAVNNGIVFANTVYTVM